jgi:hypothetical protein
LLQSITKHTTKAVNTRLKNANFVGTVNWCCAQPCAITAAPVVMSGKMTSPKVTQPAEVTITKIPTGNFLAHFLQPIKTAFL